MSVTSEEDSDENQGCEVPDCSTRNRGKYGQGTIAEKLGEIGAGRDEAWRLVVAAIAQSTHSLVRYTDNKAAGLRISSSERKRLRHELDSTFGPSVREKVRAGQKPLQFAAGMLYTFLSDAKWKATDE